MSWFKSLIGLDLQRVRYPQPYSLATAGATVLSTSRANNPLIYKDAFHGLSMVFGDLLSHLGGSPML